MKCVRLHEYGGVELFRVEEIGSPEPGPGQLLVQIAGAAVNPVDAKLRSGLYREWLPLTFPSILGADFSGTVVAVGAGVNESRMGERVMGMVDVLKSGAYAEQMVVDAQDAVPVPEGLDLVEAAALPMGVMTGYDLVELGLDIRAGERVAVTGAAGSVGRAAAYAAERGAEVIAIVRSEPRAPISGATRTINVADQAAIAAAGPFDCIADTVGGEVMEFMLQHVQPAGRLCTATSTPPTVPEGSQVSATSFVVSRNASQLARFANALASGAAMLPPPTRHGLEKVGEVHLMLEAGGAGNKFVLVP